MLTHPLRMNDHERNSERPSFDLGTGLITRDIYVLYPDGSMKSTSKKQTTSRRHGDPSLCSKGDDKSPLSCSRTGGARSYAMRTAVG